MYIDDLPLSQSIYLQINLEFFLIINRIKRFRQYDSYMQGDFPLLK